MENFNKVLTQTDRLFILESNFNFMNYSLSLLRTTSQIDEVLKIVNRDIRTLEARKLTWSARVENSAEDAIAFDAEMAADQLELENLNARILTYPEGKERDQKIGEKMTLEAKIFNRNLAKGQKNGVDQVELEYDTEVLRRSLEAAQELKAQLEAKKAEMTAA